MPGPTPDQPNLRLLKGNPGKRPTRGLPEPTCTEECPPPPTRLSAYAQKEWRDVALESAATGRGGDRANGEA